MKLLPSLLLLATLPALAQSTDLQRCRALAESGARLACYDALADQAAKNPTPVGSATAAPAARPAADRFGIVERPKDEPDAVRSRISGQFEGWNPGGLITLDNGQVWAIADGSSAVVYLKNPQVTIRRGALGSFVLELEGSNHSAKVKRVK